MDSLSFLSSLRDISKQFEVGYEIIVADASIVIKGYDYHEQHEHHAIERTYELQFETDEDGRLKDTLTPVLGRISEETCLR